MYLSNLPFDAFKRLIYKFRGGNVVKIVSVSFWKWVYAKRVAFVPLGSEAFPFIVDCFSEGAWV